ncbi:hypothetical protein QOZ80_6AG0542990 [Eleusine coracana subsp. coracana]|nr:hypothetical protein QOZ80_6AG0542990 [Eleusine coracana subsp. coracana]
MTGNASCQQFGVDAMMMGSGCFVSSSTVAADAATLPEYAPHDDGSLFGLGGFSADVDDGTALAGQLQLAPQSVYGYGASPSDVTVALPPAATAKLAGDPNRGCWVQVQEQYYCPPACLSGDPFTTAARELSLRLAAESSSTGGTGVSSLPDQSSDVSCSGVTHASSGLVFQQPPAYGVEQQGGGRTSLSSEDHPPHHNLRDDLLKLLQLMDQRCNQCLDEMQSAACKYGSMVRPGALSAPFAHRAVAATHRRLRARIVAEIAAATRTTQRGRDQCSSLADRERSWESAFIEKHWALRQLRRGDQQSWRPQRGLPEKSVAVLKAWMFENFLRPYPKDNEKEMLAARSGLSRSQVQFQASISMRCN